jgi:molybdopterin-guanine dinucleotide biosynthesis protein B
MRPVVLGFYGSSGAGKTQCIVQLVTRLVQKGYHVATVKTTDRHISVDSEGKDTWRHRQAGATVVVFSSPVETDILVPKSLPIEEIVDQICLLGDYDVVLVEGAHDPDVEKIQIGTGKPRKNTIASFRGDVQGLVELVEKKVAKNKAVQQKASVCVRVNGRLVPLTPFPLEMIKNTIVGLLCSLKGVDEIHQFEVSFDDNKSSGKK